MKWIKKGFICSHETFNLDWYKKNTMVPVPYLIDKKTLRIYLAMCDKNNVGRVGYVDVNPLNPNELINYCKTPILDIGDDGSFDDTGVLPSSIFEEDGKLYMFYSAYQQQVKIPYYVLGGLSVSTDMGKSFNRVSKVPFLERTDNELYIRSSINCIKHEDKYMIYYSGGKEWTNNNTNKVPKYDIRLVITNSLLSNKLDNSRTVIDLQGDEYGLTTSKVWFEHNMFKILYSIRSISKGYRLGYAESLDGIDWKRMDEKMLIDISKTGWDSEMICFGNIFDYKELRYLFYCGNHYGLDGFGYAKLHKND